MNETINSASSQIVGFGTAQVYRSLECVTFKKTGERFGGLSNMAPGFGLYVNSVPIRTSEALYQACRFPHLPEVQRLVIAQASPMAAKMKSKPHRANSRPDWDLVRVPIMRWCLRVKLAQNFARFGMLLKETGDRPIVEESHKDDFWGAKPRTDGTLVGANILGRLLMKLREAVRSDESVGVETLRVSDFLLYGQPMLRLYGQPMRGDK